MQSGRRDLNRASALLGALFGLCACVAQPGGPGYVTPSYATPGGTTGASVPTPAGRRIAVLLPLSGSSAELGRSLLRAVRLGLNAPESSFDERDTKGTPSGATEAATAALAAGAGIVVGPLTAAETAAVAGVMRPRGVPVLAFTSDPARAQPGTWPLGLTPAQQIRPLIMALRADNRGRLGGVLPLNPFGDALADGLIQSARESGMPPPQIVRYQPGRAMLDVAIAQLGGTPGAPPRVDALLLGSTAEEAIAALPALASAGLGPDRVRLLGTTLWARNPTQHAALAGAWFAGPTEQTVRLFEQNFMARYGTPPREFASIAFDAAAAARAVAKPDRIDVDTLLSPSGFSGANGVFVLLPDGRVRRSLALFEITPDGVRMRDANPGM